MADPIKLPTIDEAETEKAIMKKKLSQKDKIKKLYPTRDQDTDE
jgi:hypothetical protein